VVGAGEKNGEFVSSVAVGVTTLDNLADGGGELAQDFVAGKVTHRVVDDLEAVDVKQHHADRGLSVAGVADLFVDPLVEGAVIAKARQRVCGGLGARVC
jgi:hypothetical protein